MTYDIKCDMYTASNTSGDLLPNVVAVYMRAWVDYDTRRIDRYNPIGRGTILPWNWSFSLQT